MTEAAPTGGLYWPQEREELGMNPLLERDQEVWRQDSLDADLWHGSKGVIVNSAALEEREVYFEVIRLRQNLPSEAQDDFVAV